MYLPTAFDNEIGNQGEDMPIRNGNATVLREIPRPDTDLNGKILDKQGNTVSPASPTLMSRLNDKSKDEFTITKGMAAIIAILLTAAGLFLGYISPSIREGGRESEKVVTIERDVKESREDMKRLGEKFDKLNDRIIEQQRFIDRMGAAAAVQGPEDK